MRAFEAEEKQPYAKTVTTTTPTTKHKHADTKGDPQNDVSKEKTTSRCSHHPSKNSDLSFHSEDLLGYSRNSYDSTFNKENGTQKVSILSAPAKGYWARLSPADLRVPTCLHPTGVAKLGHQCLPAPLAPDQPYLPPPSSLSVARRPLNLRSQPSPLAEPHHKHDLDNKSRAKVIDQHRGTRHCERTTLAPAPPPPNHGDARPEGAVRAVAA
jgi:hypothetical protein